CRPEEPGADAPVQALEGGHASDDPVLELGKTPGVVREDVQGKRARVETSPFVEDRQVVGHETPAPRTREVEVRARARLARASPTGDQQPAPTLAAEGARVYEGGPPLEESHLHGGEEMPVQEGAREHLGVGEPMMVCEAEDR